MNLIYEMSDVSINSSQKSTTNFNPLKQFRMSNPRFNEFQNLCVKTMSAMAQGLFASLLIGTILTTLGSQLHVPFLTEVGDYAKSATGSAMAAAVGHSMGAAPLVLFSLLAVGDACNTLAGSGGPFAVLIVSVLTCYLSKLVSQKTKFDIILTPLVTMTGGVLLAHLLAPFIGSVTVGIGHTIGWATELQPFFMGIVLSVFMGMALTLPISSAALCAGLGLTGLAGGASLVGCCAQMVGFATMSYKENGFSGLLSQGLGTSMLQMSNIMKNPYIWLPPILVSVITGALSTTVFHLEMNGAAVSSGMGTCGLVGQIGIYTGWLTEMEEGTRLAITTFDWLSMLLLCFIIPAVLTPLFCSGFQKLGYIKEGDMKL